MHSIGPLIMNQQKDKTLPSTMKQKHCYKGGSMISYIDSVHFHALKQWKIVLIINHVAWMINHSWADHQPFSIIIADDWTRSSIFDHLTFTHHYSASLSITIPHGILWLTIIWSLNHGRRWKSGRLWRWIDQPLRCALTWWDLHHHRCYGDVLGGLITGLWGIYA